MKRRDLKPIILEQSWKLIREKGYDAVTIQDICAACDITKPTFYNYAENKGDLIRHFFEDIPDRLEDIWADHSIQGNWFECIRLGFTQYLAQFLDYGLDFCRQLYIQNICSPEDAFRIDASFEKKMCTVIARAQESGDILSEAEPEQLVSVILSVMIGYVGNWLIHDGKTDILEGFTDSLRTICEAAA